MVDLYEGAWHMALDKRERSAAKIAFPMYKSLQDYLGSQVQTVLTLTRPVIIRMHVQVYIAIDCAA